MRRWQERNFVLDSTGLFAYFKAGNSQPQGAINVQKCVRWFDHDKADIEWPAACPPGCGFGLATPSERGRVYFCYTSSEAELVRWKGLLCGMANLCLCCGLPCFSAAAPINVTTATAGRDTAAATAPVPALASSQNDGIAVAAEAVDTMGIDDGAAPVAVSMGGSPGLYHTQCFKCVVCAKTFYPRGARPYSVCSRALCYQHAIEAAQKDADRNAASGRDRSESGDFVRRASLAKTSLYVDVVVATFKTVTAETAKPLLDKYVAKSAAEMAAYAAENGIGTMQAGTGTKFGTQANEGGAAVVGTAVVRGEAGGGATATKMQASGISSVFAAEAAEASDPMLATGASASTLASVDAVVRGKGDAVTMTQSESTAASAATAISPPSSSISPSSAAANSGGTVSTPPPSPKTSRKENKGADRVQITHELIQCAVYGILDSISRLGGKTSSQSRVRRKIYLPTQKAFEFVDYAPAKFDEMRRAHGIEANEYALSFTVPPDLSKAVDGGRSGSFVIRSHDDKYILKTLPSHERSVLASILEHYATHMQQYPDSLLCRFCGLHELKLAGSKTKYINFVVMENILAKARDISIHEVYDLKGSYVDRRAISSSVKDPRNFRGTRKDMDLRRPLIVGERGQAILASHLTSDAGFLNSLNLMDYSLLVGIHNCDPDGRCCEQRRRMERSEDGKVRAKDILEWGVRGAGPPDSEGKTESVYFFGIIDLLQQWDKSKVAEQFLKSRVLKKDKHGISAVNSDEYATRFLDNIIARIRAD